MRDEVGFSIEFDRLFCTTPDSEVPKIYHRVYLDREPDDDDNKRDSSLFESCMGETLRSFFLGNFTASHLLVSFFICTKCLSSSLKSELTSIDPDDINEDHLPPDYKFNKERIGEIILTPIHESISRENKELSLLHGFTFSENTKQNDPSEKAFRIYSAAREEVIRSIAENLNILATAGLRIMIDVLVSHRYSGHTGDGGSFSERIKKIHEDGILNEKNRKFLSHLVDWGNKAAHFGEKLHRQDIINSIAHLDRIAVFILFDEKIHAEFLEKKPRRINIKRRDLTQNPDTKIIHFPGKDDTN
jgi:hypothetical protein